jgi:hypothetical protein
MGPTTAPAVKPRGLLKNVGSGHSLQGRPGDNASHPRISGDRASPFNAHLNDVSAVLIGLTGADGNSARLHRFGHLTYQFNL